MLKNNKKRIIAGGLLIVMLIFMYVCHSNGIFRNCTAESVKDYVNSFGSLAPLVYIVMFTFVPLTLFPDSVLVISAGMLFGIYAAAVYTMMGAICGATLAFFLSRFLGKDLIEKLLQHKGGQIVEEIGKKGFILILILRLIPLVPFDVISYGAGLSKIKYGDFIFATLLGIIPGVLVFTNLGDKAGNLGSIEFLEALVILGLLLVTSYLMRKKISFGGYESE